jgi:hypothetical protein
MLLDLIARVEQAIIAGTTRVSMGELPAHEVRHRQYRKEREQCDHSFRVVNLSWVSVQ